MLSRHFGMFLALVLLGDDARSQSIEALPDFDLPQLSARGDAVNDLRNLRVKAKELGHLSVIAGLRMKSGNDADLDERAQSDQRSRIAVMQESLLGEFAAGAREGAKRFRYSPHVALTVSPETLEYLLRSERVTSVEEDIAVKPMLSQSVPLINANKAWAAGYGGSGWTVAILDTGVQSNHPFLADKVAHEACFSTANSSLGSQSLCPNGADQQTGIGAAAPCATDCEHGTHVAGIATGASASLSGVAPNASVIAIQVFSRFTTEAQCGAGQAPCVKVLSSDWMRALEYLYSIRTQHRIAAVNMSLGGSKSAGYCDGYSDVRASKQVIDNLRAAGIATIIASGNDGYVDAIGFPACISSAISVGGVWDTTGYQNNCFDMNGGATNIDKVACYSNSAAILDLLAPGSLINSSVPGGSYQGFQGTSMAAPHVAGCWAILKQGKPTATVDQIKQALIATGVSVQDWRNGVTKPRVNCKAALDRLTGTTAPTGAADLQISISSVSPSSVAGGGQVSISATVRNAGTTASSATTLRYYRSTDATLSSADTALSCPAAIGSLAPNGATSAPVCQVNAPGTAGTYYYGVCVDAVSGEVDTANNCANGQIVSVTAGGQPDLAVASVSTAAQMSVGGVLAVSAVVQNRGGAAAGASRAKYYLSTNTTITTGDIFLANCEVSALAPNASYSCAVNALVSSVVTPGSYYVGAIVDTDNVVAESNESNNTLAASSLTTVTNTGVISTLGEGVDNTALQWVTGGDANWFRQTTTSFAGGDAVQSGAIGDKQASYLQTTVTGPGTVSFYWKVSSEPDYDSLAVLLDNELVNYITGEKDWQQNTLTIPSGTHAVTWGYVKDESISGGQDAGWVDQVLFVPGGAGLFVSRPVSGSGVVTSSPAGINCGTDCSETYAVGASVTLSALPGTGYIFNGWSGACSGVGGCSLAMNASKSVTALFSRPDEGFPASPLPQGWSLSPAGSDSPWRIVSDSANKGRFSLRSGIIGNDQVTGITFTGAFKDGQVSFARKVSCESGYDLYAFFIDDTLVDDGSGEIDWTEVSYPISAGPHTLTWAYAKDGTLSSGGDAAWIDSVSLPLGIAPESGWWWNPSESGRGFSIEVNGNSLFMASFLYEAGGRSVWYAAGGALNADGSYSGQLQEYAGGQTLTGAYRPAAVKNNASNVSLNCSSRTACNLTWAGGTVPLQRFIFDSAAKPASAPETGWWWNTAESGRGYFLEMQGNTLFATGYMYDPGGNALWYLASGAATATGFQSNWSQYANGQTLAGHYVAPVVSNSNVGAVSLQFTDTTHAILTLPDGRQVSITRFRF